MFPKIKINIVHDVMAAMLSRTFRAMRPALVPFLSIVAFVDFLYIPSSSNSSSLTKYQCQPRPTQSYHVTWQ